LNSVSQDGQTPQIACLPEVWCGTNQEGTLNIRRQHAEGQGDRARPLHPRRRRGDIGERSGA
jgi:hypothetical protein